MVNAVALTGRTIEWTVSTSVLAVILVELVLVAAALIAFAYLEMRKRASKKKQDIFVGYVAYAEEERKLIGISLDVSAVRREFRFGEAFDPEGLVVTANYDREPYSEPVRDYRVEAPVLGEIGENPVAVKYGGFTETYTVVVLPEAEERRPVELELDLGTVRTDYLVGETFDPEGLVVTARFNAAPYEERVTDFVCEAPDLSEKGMKNVVVRYGELTQTYPVFVAEGRALVGLSLNTDAVRREFTAGEAFDCTGLVVRAEYDAEPFAEEVGDYETEVPDLTEAGEKEVRVHFSGMTAVYSVRVVAPAEEPVEEAPVEETPAEEPAEIALAEGETLRYDRSFTARLIQADEDTKRRYSFLKNELLSYEGVKCRMSWRKETFKAAGEHAARLGFRGNLLCLFLPLDPAEYDGSRYKVENAATGRSDEEMPCLFRIKNDKRARLAADLIAKVMDGRGIPKSGRPEHDYAMSYQPTERLLRDGLVRAVIKNRVDDSMFVRNQDGDEN